MYVFRTGKPALMTRKIVDELVTLGEVEFYATQSVSWVGAPLKTSQGVIGVMAAQDYHNPNCYSDGDRDMLASIAGQVALVIERIQAEKELRLSEEKYRNLSQVLEQG
jgi:GAF domain-containing protein